MVRCFVLRKVADDTHWTMEIDNYRHLDWNHSRGTKHEHDQNCKNKTHISKAFKLPVSFWYVPVSLAPWDLLHLAKDNRRVDTIRQWHRHWATEGPPRHLDSERKRVISQCDEKEWRLSKSCKHESQQYCNRERAAELYLSLQWHTFFKLWIHISRRAPSLKRIYTHLFNILNRCSSQDIESWSDLIGGHGGVLECWSAGVLECIRKKGKVGTLLCGNVFVTRISNVSSVAMGVQYGMNLLMTPKGRFVGVLDGAERSGAERIMSLRVRII